MPLLYLADELKRGLEQPRQMKVPFRFSLFRGEVKGGSVPSFLKTLNASEPRIFSHSSSVRVMMSVVTSAAAATDEACMGNAMRASPVPAKTILLPIIGISWLDSGLEAPCLFDAQVNDLKRVA